MKPRTKEEKVVCELSRQLKPISDKQLKFIDDHTENWATLKYGKIRCYECKKSWKPTPMPKEDEKIICPNCKKKLHFFSTKNKNYYMANHATMSSLDDIDYFTFSDTKKDYQIFRTFMLQKINFSKKQNTIKKFEIYQIWINTKTGKYFELSNCHRNCFSRIWEKPELDNKEMGIRQNINLIWEYEWNNINTTKIQPDLKRKGLTASILNKEIMNPYELTTEIIKNNKIETLIKAKQFKLTKYLLNTRSIDDYWQQIKIAFIRNKYKIKKYENISLWFDLIRDLKHLKKDITNPKFICPDNLIEAHDKWDKKRREIDEQIRRKKEIENLEKRAKEFEKAFDYRKKFESIKIESNNLKLFTLQNIKEYIDEGNSMHHCVATEHYMENQNSLIISVRNEKMERVATVELDLKKMEIEQIRGICNSKPKEYDEIKQIIENNIKEFKRLKNQKNKIKAAA